jgi:phage shock protein PspC (stress-responsive transcriptional regulator)
MSRSPWRPEGALLAGVAAELARRLRWNVWAVRGLWLFGLVLQPVAVGLAYVVAAVVVGWVLGPAASDRADDRLESEALTERARRIAELERRFSELERERDRPS